MEFLSNSLLTLLAAAFELGALHLKQRLHLAMLIEKDTLAGIASAYVKAMTSIRGRRVHRLLMREFLRYEHVLPVIAEDGSPALLALGEDGSAAVCCTDGRGETVSIAAWANLTGATVTTSYDLSRDSLPTVSWTIWHPSFDRVAGALKMNGADLSPTEHSRVSSVFRKWSGQT